jgi:hypothetical protein
MLYGSLDGIQNSCGIDCMVMDTIVLRDAKRHMAWDLVNGLSDNTVGTWDGQSVTK